MKKISRSIIFLLFSILVVTGIGTAAFTPKKLNAKSPEFAAKQFYGWYMHALNQHIYPLDSKRGQIKKYVTEKLILAIDTMPKGPSGLDGDYFIDAQEWDPAWEKNITIANSTTQGRESVVDVLLTGPLNPNHKLRVTLINESDGWKVDKVQPEK